jgi:hypothetical protein
MSAREARGDGMKAADHREAVERAARAVESAYGWQFDMALQSAADKAARDIADVEAADLVRQALALRAERQGKPT